MSQDASCPCDGAAAAPPRNPPGRSSLACRDATFATLRRTLLTPRDGETQLSAWRPGAEGDLAVMIAEWFAYLGDILTFYNERIANEDYLRTAAQPASLRRLIRLLGYRPQPGIGATATLAALLQPGTATATLPAGMQVQSKPGPGQAPQVFELATTTTLTAPDLVAATPQLAMLSPEPTTLLLAGAVSAIIGGMYLLLRPRSGKPPALVQVHRASIVTLPGGAQQTVAIVSLNTVDPPGPAAGFRLEQASQSTGLWSFAGAAIEQDRRNVHLSGLVRTLRLGDVVLFTVQGQAPLLTSVTGISDLVWDNTGAVPPAQPVTAAIFPHTRLTLADPLPGGANAGTVTLWHGWVEAARPLDQPVPHWPPPDPPGGPQTGTATLVPAGTTAFPKRATAAGVLIADASGAGIAAQAASADGSTLSVSGLAAPPQSLSTPLSVMFNLLQVSRGQSVPAEVLGSGDPAQANQSFRLAKSPLTYLRRGNAVVSTLAVTVNRQNWTEVPSFYGQQPDAQVFVTAEDDAGITTVQFGDGVTGARLPAGSGNVVATYRIGSGAAAPPAGALTVIGNPIPGLRALRNPVAAGGGADPDPPEQIRSYAPRSVLTFGRAVSAADFEALAASVANGNRVSASWAWDSARQRGAVTIHVAGDAATLAGVTAALAAAGDPNRPVNVVPAQPVPLLLAMALRIAPGAVADDVKAGIVAALTDPAEGLFGAARLGIGQGVFDSQIAAACQAVPGVVAVTFLVFFRIGTGWDMAPLHIPPAGTYFSLDPALVWLFPEVAANAG